MKELSAVQKIQFIHLFKDKLKVLFKVYSDLTTVNMKFQSFSTYDQGVGCEIMVELSELNQEFLYTFFISSDTADRVDKNDTIDDYKWEHLKDWSTTDYSVVYQVKHKDIGDKLLQEI